MNYINFETWTDAVAFYNAAMKATNIVDCAIEVRFTEATLGEDPIFMPFISFFRKNAKNQWMADGISNDGKLVNKRSIKFYGPAYTVRIQYQYHS
jgi:hypothetical protein